VRTITILTLQNEQAKKLAARMAENDFSCTVVTETDVTPASIINSNPDMVLIDLISVPSLEKMCRDVKRELDIPVMIIAPLPLVLRLDGHVDDFVGNLASIDEMVIRVKRLFDKTGKPVKTNQISAKGLLIDPEKFEVYVNGKLVDLTFKEYELLKFLASNPGRVFTRDMLLNRVWGEDYFGGDRSVDVQIRRLRSKIEDENTTFIDTVRNIGYRFKKS
jgi:two-component system, OmpR family, alkaline phosphatase synthesis response regulator PhoP